MFVGTERYIPLEIVGEMTDRENAAALCERIYTFIDQFEIRNLSSEGKVQFASCVAAFPTQEIHSLEDAGEKLFTLLKNMHEYDTKKGYTWAKDVSRNPKHPQFSFSLGGEAFFIPFFHKHTYAPARESSIPLLVFNSHRLFQVLREKGKFAAGRELIRENQLRRFGWVPELLSDYGDGLEFPQYLLPPTEKLEDMWHILQKVAGDYPFG